MPFASLMTFDKDGNLVYGLDISDWNGLAATLKYTCWCGRLIGEAWHSHHASDVATSCDASLFKLPQSCHDCLDNEQSSALVPCTRHIQFFGHLPKEMDPPQHSAGAKGPRPSPYLSPCYVCSEALSHISAEQHILIDLGTILQAFLLPHMGASSSSGSDSGTPAPVSARYTCELLLLEAF